MFEYRTMCRDVAESLWALYHGRPDAPCLILPSKRDGVLRVSEQESRILIAQWLQSHGVRYSIETPTLGRYQQSGQAQLSARIDVTTYGSRHAANRTMNLELKAGTASLEAFRKDFEKLLREGIPGLWFHTLESASNATWDTLSNKMEEALERVAPHADTAGHKIWFAFCVLNVPRLVEFEVDFSGKWRGQVGHLLANALGRPSSPVHRGTLGEDRKSAPVHRAPSGPSSGTQRKLLIYAPSINPSTFLHLSIKGESYALRDFGRSGPATRWVLEDARTTTQLAAKHRFVRAIDVAGERKSLESESDYWRQRIAAVNRRYRVG